ncbi:hypothetical protein GX48_07394 [Paracoccidioides brasiliensis]|nr:hypothetical protein GX48_07394 [Paracoccidioides brasiliensis]
MAAAARSDHARIYGEHLLGGVRKESLAELLCTLHNPPATDAQYAPLGIRPLDDILRVFQAEYGRKHTYTHTTSPLAPGAVAAAATPHQPILEITSPHSADGKTHLLYYITAIAILPEMYKNTPLPGRNGAAVFIDTEYRFDVVRLREVMRAIIRDVTHPARSGRGDGREGYGGYEDRDMDVDMDDMLHNALAHVHVFRPQSSAALLATVEGVEDYLLRGAERRCHVSHLRPLNVIVLDSASAFYWQDRREMEVLGIPGVREERERRARNDERGNGNGDGDEKHTGTGTGTGTGQQQQQQNLPQKITRALQALQHTFSCPLIYTTWGLQPALPRPYTQPAHANANANANARTSIAAPNIPLYKSPHPSYRPYLPRPWPSLATCRVVLQRESVRSFAPLLTLEEIMGEAGMRLEVVRRGRVVGWVDGGVGAEVRRGGTDMERERERVVEGVFGFWLTGRGGVEWLDGDGEV